MATTLNPGLVQSLQVAGQNADAARRHREMMLAQQAQQQEQQRQQQQSSMNPNMLRQFMPQSSGITAAPGYNSGGPAVASADGMTGVWGPVGGGGLGGLGGVSVSPAFVGGGTATSGLGAGGSLGAFAQGGAGAGGLGGLGGGAAAGGGGAAAGGTAALGATGIGALVLAGIANENHARNNGYRRGGSDYYKDLATGRVLSQDVDKRWAPMLFGKSDNLGLGKDMSFAADLGSFQFGKAFKDLKGSSLLTGFGLFK